MPRLAIQADRVSGMAAVDAPFAGRWLQLAAEREMATCVVDVRSPRLFDDLATCDAFLWRFTVHPKTRMLAKKLLPAIEQGLALPVFPAIGQTWWAEDKVAQHFLLTSTQLPYPRTWLLWDKRAAIEFCHDATYPLVLKLATGFGSANVCLLRTREDALRWIELLFGGGVARLDQRPPTRLRQMRKQLGTVRRLLQNRAEDREHGYLLVQEFLAGNDHDTRITVIGDHVFGFRRWNRADDFRASGSGRIDYDPQGVDIHAVRLGLQVARRLGSRCIAVDVMKRGDELVVAELNFSFRASAIDACPGHWMSSQEGHQLHWCDGALRAADAVFFDALAQFDLDHGRA